FALALLAHRLGYSVALGAFLAGSLVAESGHGEEIERLIAPLRDLFAAIFFVAVGMMVDPRDAAEHWAVVLALGAAVLVGQSALVAIGTFLAGNDLRSSIRVGMSLAQIGEFSFIIAGIGTSAGAARDFLYPVAVAVCILTSFTTPWMVRRSGRVARAIESRLPHALQTFASLYGSWREQLRERARRRTVSARIRRQVRLLLLDGALLAALLVAGAVAHERYAPVLAARLRLGPGLSLALVVGATALVALPFAIGLLRLTRGLGTTLARVVLPAAGRGELDLAAAPRRAFRVTVQLGVALLVGLPFLALTRPFLPFWMGLALLGLALFGLGIAFWRSARNLDEHVRAGAHLVLEVLVRQAGRPAIAQRAPLDQVATALPGLGHLTAVTLEPGSPAVGRTLIELDLRGSTGASVIAIGRASGPGEDVAAPTGREVLAVGDILTLTGTSEAVGAAAALLLGESASPAPAAILPR
ncbi:MAG TPA: cation:proton antiporter, partial [Candidatus Acidoferrum sp.]|nr:cation:proton antiporter [Candidatus Acidoferrum sp.]